MIFIKVCLFLLLREVVADGTSLRVASDSQADNSQFGIGATNDHSQMTRALGRKLQTHKGECSPKGNGKKAMSWCNEDLNRNCCTGLALVAGTKKPSFAPDRATAMTLAMTTEESLARARATASVPVIKIGGTLI
jgi:hypothetical protein